LGQQAMRLPMSHGDSCLFLLGSELVRSFRPSSVLCLADQCRHNRREGMIALALSAPMLRPARASEPPLARREFLSQFSDELMILLRWRLGARYQWQQSISTLEHG